MEFKFNKYNNYIGSTEYQKTWTKHIFKKQPDINFTAAKHDVHYSMIFAERNQVVRLIMKIMYDLVFLVLGITRCFKNLRWGGIGIIMIFYIVLLISSPYYLWINRNVIFDLD